MVQQNLDGRQTPPDILQFIENSTPEIITQNLENIIKNFRYCDITLGRGLSGSVYQKNVGNSIPMKIGNYSFDLPVTVKESIANPNDRVICVTIDDKKFMFGYDNMTLYLIAMLYIGRVWTSKKTPHINIAISYGTCKSSSEIDMIITEQCGLQKPVEFNLDKYVDISNGVLFSNTTKIKINNYMSNLYEFFSAVMPKRKGMNVLLPNGIDADIIEIYDYFIFSFIHTYLVLSNNNIHLFGIDSNRLFIYWLSKTSYMADKYIGDCEYIYYKVGDKIYKFKTFGVMIKIDDFNSAIIQPTTDMIIISNCIDLNSIMPMLHQLFNPAYAIVGELMAMTYVDPKIYFESTIYKKVLSKPPYNKIPSPYLDKKYGDELLHPEKMLHAFVKYKVDNVNKSEKHIVVENK